MFDWRALLPHAVWAAIGALGAYLWNWFQSWRTARGQAAILAGLDRPTLFVFPPRKTEGGVPPLEGGDPQHAAGRLIPWLAIEDFLAINNIISVYIRIGRRPPDHFKTCNFLVESDEKHNNLILICSSKSNTATKEALDLLRAQYDRFKDRVPYFEKVPGKEQIQIRFKKGVYPSESYDQKGSVQDDIAMIVKARNPWAGQHRVLIVAGIRGIGTWGAAEFLKKWWEPLYHAKEASRKRGTSKQGNFAAIVSVHYENYDIKNVTLVNFADLEGPSVDSNAQQRGPGEGSDVASRRRGFGEA